MSTIAPPRPRFKPKLVPFSIPKVNPLPVWVPEEEDIPHQPKTTP